MVWYNHALRNYWDFLRACLHGGGGPQVGEVLHLPVVKESWLSHAIFTTPGRWGEVSKWFYSAIAKLNTGLSLCTSPTRPG